ncbi:MAG: hypothetical protein ABUR63_08270 [Verrucomicrobiota bacterium]
MLGTPDRFLSVVVSAFALLAFAGGLACDDCHRFRQTVTIDPPTAEISALASACVDKTQLPGGATCPGAARPSGPTAVDCFCRPLCDRVMEIIDQFSGSESLLECNVSTSSSTGAVVVRVEYGKCQ